jgi:MFS family permease
MRTASRAWINTASAALAVLAFINLFNYLDRYLLAALVVPIQKSELALTDEQLGSLQTAFLIVFALVAPLFGVLGDRGSRTRLIALGVGCWSVATALSGLASSYVALFAARAAVGVGEAAYVTIAPSLLSDYFPREQRGRVMAIFFCGIPVGSALGYVLGGLMEHYFGWRSAFFIAGAPGVVLALLCLGLRDPPRGSQDPGGAGREGGAAKRPSAPTYRALLANQAYVLTILGYAAYTFALGGLAFWMPAFLERTRGIPRIEATRDFGLIVVVTGLVGTFVGGWLGDFAARYSPRAHLWISALATLLAAPAAWIALTAQSSALYYGAMVSAQLLMFLSTGPINASIVNLVSPIQRASANALGVLSIHVLGDVPSPWLIGKLSMASSLGEAVKIVPLAILVSACIWLMAARAQGRAPSASRSARDAEPRI